MNQSQKSCFLMSTNHKVCNIISSVFTGPSIIWSIILIENEKVCWFLKQTKSFNRIIENFQTLKEIITINLNNKVKAYKNVMAEALI